MTLDEIYSKYQSLNLAGLNGSSEKFVPGDGPCPAKLMIIGEAPGEQEDIIGLPFQGPSGRLLNRLLENAGSKREEVFVTNIFKYRPPENRTPFPSEIIPSLPCLSAEIKCVDPEVIILAGRTATQAVFPAKSVRQLRGKLIPKGNRFVVCTYHPAAMIRSPQSKSMALLRRDIKLAVQSVGKAR